MLTRPIGFHATNHVGTPFHRLFSIGGSELASEALKDDSCVCANLEILYRVVVAMKLC
jgi:hypothetical protein